MPVGEKTVGAQTSAFPTSLRTFVAQNEANDPGSEDADSIEGRNFNLPAAELEAVQATLGASPRGLVEVAGTTATAGALRVQDGYTVVVYAGGTVALTPSVLNYIYFDLVSLTLKKSTTGFPTSTKHVPLATWSGTGTTVTDVRTHLVAAGAGVGDLPRGYIDGLILSNNATDPDNDIDVSAGDAMDSTNTYKMHSPATITKKIDVAFAAGDDAGGFAPAGSVAADTWYYVFLIRTTADGGVDVMFDDDIDAANIPAAFGAYRRIGQVLTAGDASIRQFTQWGDEFTWNIVDRDATTTALTTARMTLAVRTPPGFRTLAHLRVLMSSGAGGTMVIVQPISADDEAPGIGAADPGANFQTTGGPLIAQFDVLTDDASSVAARASAASTTLSLFTIGYRDTRGRDA